MTDHIGDDAALYALGMLEPDERDRIDAHAASCDACVRLLGQAEADVTAAILTQPIAAPPVADLASKRAAVAKPARYAMPVRALAAALVVALLPLGYFYQQNRAMQVAMSMESDAMTRMAASPHKVVAFAGSDAKVIYGKDGSWYCVVVHGVRTPMNVMWMHDGTQTDLGRVTPMPHKDMALLYLPASHRMDQLALVSNGQIVAQAQLVF
jgi:anti-sigma factor RsiW